VSPSGFSLENQSKRPTALTLLVWSSSRQSSLRYEGSCCECSGGPLFEHRNETAEAVSLGRPKMSLRFSFQGPREGLRVIASDWLLTWGGEP
jgi:hypothetical protein